ncbi:ribosomal maturation YjgA family protein [Campylobacter concisus]
MRHSLRVRLSFLAVAVVILAIEIYIAAFVKGGFVRHYLGDVLVTAMLYAFVRAVFKTAPKILVFEIFAFSLFIEILQYFKMLEILDIHNLIIRIVFGGTFDVSDIVCYALGCLLAYLTDAICFLQKYKSPKI